MKRCLTSGTRCNRCALDDFERLAKQTNRVVTLRPNPKDGFPDGQDVFVHPATESEEKIAEWRAGWLGSVPEHCVC